MDFCLKVEESAVGRGKIIVGDEIHGGGRGSRILSRTLVLARFGNFDRFGLFCGSRASSFLVMEVWK